MLDEDLVKGRKKVLVSGTCGFLIGAGIAFLLIHFG